MALRPLNRIAADILNSWGTQALNPKKRTAYQTYSMPYVQAMLDLRQISDYYGLDDGEDIIIRFLSNAAAWRGDTARSIKAELNAHLKEKQCLL